MLQRIREKLTGGVAVVILALIGIPFVFFGMSNLPFLNAQFAAKVDGSEISAAQFEQAYRRQLEGNPSWAQLPDQFRQQIRRGVLDSLIRNRLVELHLSKKGYRISDTQLTTAVHGVAAFQTDGKFDKDKYREVLGQNGFEQPSVFEAEQRRAMRGDQLQRAIIGTALITPSDYRRYLNLVGEQRLVSLATFDVDAVADGVEVTDDGIQAFYDENDTMFLKPESADIEMIEIRRDEVARSIEISDEELAQYYEQEKGRYLQDEQRRARHILIVPEDGNDEEARALADQLLARIRSGESFDALAREYSKDGGTAPDGGDLGALTRSQMVPEKLGDAVFSMNEGEVAGPIESEYGYHIVRLDEILARGPLPLDQVRGDLLAELRDREAESRFRELERKASDALFDAPDMQAVSAAVGIDVQSATGITREGGEPIGSNQAAIDAIFSDPVLHGGQISEVTELDANRSAIFKVTAFHEATRLPLDEVRDQIVDSIRQKEAEQIVFGKAEELLVAVDAGQDFGVAAEAVGATVQPPQLIARNDPDVDQYVVSQVFDARKPVDDQAVYGQVADPDGGYTVYSLQAVVEGRPETIPQADRDKGKLQLAQEAGGMDYLAFVQGLYERADVVISKDALAAEDFLQ